MQSHQPTSKEKEHHQYRSQPSRRWPTILPKVANDSRPRLPTAPACGDVLRTALNMGCGTKTTSTYRIRNQKQQSLPLKASGLRDLFLAIPFVSSRSLEFQGMHCAARTSRSYSSNKRHPVQMDGNEKITAGLATIDTSGTHRYAFYSASRSALA